MKTEIDQAMGVVESAEATLTADQQTVATIEAAIEDANAPLGAAKAAVVADITAYNSAIDSAVIALQAAKVTVAS